ncbi:MAG: Glycerol-3-phosphate acyltransferase [Gemmatimonadaceae bacterium]|nr:Glycerol-3-phosphate acyltransferase [Gemmatimonadaceae bacterium]
MHPALGLPISYLVGSIPAALIAGKLLRGIDLREHGSGNLGATNVLRTLGPAVAAPVLAFDAMKGFLPAFVLPLAIPSSRPDVWAITYGIAAIVGHVRPIFLLGRGGGKGVATTAGVMAALAPVQFVIAFAIFAIVVAVTRYVSLASIVAAATLPFVLLLRRPASPVLIAFGVFIAGFVIWTHRSNIARLVRGEESRLGHRTGGT